MQIESIEETIQGNDAFCDQKVIDKQLVFEGKEINILYNYAPIVLGEGKLHFLIVPKQHRSKFTDLTETEYLDVMQLSQKLVGFYKGKGYHTAYLFDKTGIEAGQTVPHWHEHVVFTATKTQEFFGKLTVLKNMLFGSSPLPSKELQIRVLLLKEDLNEVFSN
jgi:diadenosine tetraphosphate (Ap4A) HIT family hydrolase